MTFTQIAVIGLAAVGAHTLYKQSPFKIGLGARYAGQRGSIEEAMRWEMGGHPSQTRMMPRR